MVLLKSQSWQGGYYCSSSHSWQGCYYRIVTFQVSPDKMVTLVPFQVSPGKVATTE